MSEQPPEEQPYPWLPLAQVRSWLKVADSVSDDDIEVVRRAAADYVEDARRDLFVTLNDVSTFTWSPRILQGALLAAARLWARKGSPAGLASFAEFGAAQVLRNDPDVSRLLGIDGFAAPRVG